MQVFSGKIRPSGDIGTEVVRSDLTAAEVMVLRELHGEDAVVDLKVKRNDRRKHAEEYERLVRRYSRSPDGRKAMAALFGSPQNPNLPATLAGFDEGTTDKVTQKARGGE